MKCFRPLRPSVLSMAAPAVPLNRGRGCEGKRSRLPACAGKPLERERCFCRAASCSRLPPSYLSSKPNRKLLVAGVSVEPSNQQPATMRLKDQLGRAITDLRISITDRCNYKCVYCRTGNEGAIYADLPMSDYSRMVRLFVSQGIEKVRITGGEPLLRHGVVEFVRELAQLRTLDGKKLDLAITTNGHLLAEMAQPLKDAGLTRVTVSMDAVDPAKFARITRTSNGYEN